MTASSDATPLDFDIITSPSVDSGSVSGLRPLPSMDFASAVTDDEITSPALDPAPVPSRSGAVSNELATLLRGDGDDLAGLAYAPLALGVVAWLFVLSMLAH
jgi:hypothetical protein